MLMLSSTNANTNTDLWLKISINYLTSTTKNETPYTEFTCRPIHSVVCNLQPQLNTLFHSQFDWTLQMISNRVSIKVSYIFSFFSWEADGSPRELDDSFLRVWVLWMLFDKCFGSLWLNFLCLISWTFYLKYLSIKVECNTFGESTEK